MKLFVEQMKYTIIMSAFVFEFVAKLLCISAANQKFNTATNIVTAAEM